MIVTRPFDRRTSGDEMLMHRRAVKLGAGTFDVVGRDGETRCRVHLDPDGQAFCTCPAGQHDRLCWHKAAAARAVLGESAANGSPVMVVLRGDLAAAPHFVVLVGGVEEEGGE